MEEILDSTQIVASLTVGQLRDLLRECLTNERPHSESQEKRYVYGLKGIQSLLNCSHTMAQKYKDGILKDAVMQSGRKIVVDAEKVKMYDYAPRCYQEGQELDSRFYLDNDTVKFIGTIA